MTATLEVKPGSGAGPKPDLDSRHSRAPWLVGLVLVVAAVAVLILVTGGGGGPIEDPRDDLDHTQGSTGDVRRPLAATAADVVEASVTEEDDAVVFAARMQAPVPQRYRSAVLEITWRLRSSEETWLVAVVIQDSVDASVTADSSGYGASTADDTLPGTVDVTGSLVTVELQREDIAGFPDSFEWFVSTRLAVDRTAADAETVRDRAPDSPTLVQHRG